MQTFEQALQYELESKDKLTRKESKILAILKSPPSRARTRQIKRMESGVRAQLDQPSTGAIDWSAIDWDKLFAAIIKLITMIMGL